MIDEKEIMAIVSVLIVIGAALFIVSFLSSQPEIDLSYDHYFDVNNSSAEQNFTTVNGLTELVVQQYDGAEWVDVIVWTYSGKIVTIPAGELH